MTTDDLSRRAEEEEPLLHASGSPASISASSSSSSSSSSSFSSRRPQPSPSRGHRRTTADHEMARGTRFRLPSVALPKPLSAIPLPALQLIGLLVFINALVWAACGVVLHFHPLLISSAVLAYTLGLRHALDADHISAIDLMTRRLIASGQRPVAVGTFFSLGHSTVVIITCVVVAATTGALRDRFDDFTRVGNIIGTSVSAAFLLLLCGGNAWVLWRLGRRLGEELRRQREAAVAVSTDDAPEDVVDALREEDANAAEAADGLQHRRPGDDGESAVARQLSLEGGGFLATVFRKLFKAVDRPWKMFPLGLIFGLGFDTSSEIALLGLASIHGAEGTNLWLILIFPILFTAGMCMLDTTDGALMMALYTSKAFSRDVVAILYYSIVLTGITIFVSAFIGIIQVLSLVQNVAEPEGSFWDGVSAIGENFDIIGGCICGVFLVVGIGSMIVYRPWRRRMERKSAAALESGVTSDAARTMAG